MKRWNFQRGTLFIWPEYVKEWSMKAQYPRAYPILQLKFGFSEVQTSQGCSETNTFEGIAEEGKADILFTFRIKTA